MKLHTLSRRGGRLLAITGVVAATVALSAPLASASVTKAPPASARRVLVAQKRVCNLEIDKRLFTLAVARYRVGEVKHLTDAQRDAERAVIDSTVGHLKTVNRPAINSATTRTALNAACRALYLDNRVYAVVVPQLFLTIRADQLATLGDALNGRIAEATAAGKDTTTAASLLAQAMAKVDAATTAVSAVTPEQFNANRAQVNAVFEQVKADLVAAADLERQAKAALDAL